MITVSNVSLKFGKRVLFEDVNLKFNNGDCYGIIGANGSGKSTFLKILSGELDTTTGTVSIDKNERMSVLKQDHYSYDDYKVVDTVIMGNSELYDIMLKKEALYSKSDFDDHDGILLGELEARFMEMNGWDAESDAKILLANLGVEEKYFDCYMKDVLNTVKVKVLLAQALFQSPDILLLDEPTNNLDINAIEWLEEFLINYSGIVIVVSHDRHFLNRVCTHIVDVDYSKMKMYLGNYDFYQESSELALKQMQQSNKRKEEKIKELQDFIARFSANASKSKQATSRKKILEKIELDEIVPSSRKYPYIDFKCEKDSGKEILTVKNLTKIVDGKKILNNVSFTVLKGDKIILVSNDSIKNTMLFKILAKEEKYDKGSIEWGRSVIQSYFPQDNTRYFDSDESLIDWIERYKKPNMEESTRNFLGRMLFSNEEVFKSVNVLSGGEKARSMFSKCMLDGANFLMMDEVTAHLDLESITSLNKALINFKGELIFTTSDHQMIDTVSNRIIDLTDDGLIDRRITYDEYIKRKNDGTL